MLKPFVHILIFALCFHSFGANGQDMISPKPSSQQYKFTHYSSKDGLPQNSILAIHQDKWGFIWMGTDDGLARFDGYRFLVYKHDEANPFSIKNNVIRAITSDQNDMIWVGREGGGVKVLNPKTGDFHSLDLSMESGEKAHFTKTSTLLKDSNGNIWVGTNGFGVFHITGFDLLPSSPTLKDLNNFLKVKAYNRSNSALADNKIWNIYEDSDGDIWIGTLDGGAYYINGQSDSMNPFDLNDNGVKVGSVKIFFEDSQGCLWIGTEKNGIFFRKKGERYFTPFKLPEKRKQFQQLDLNITSFKEDDHGKLWIGTLGRGLYVYDTELDHISHYEDDPSDHIVLTATLFTPFLKIPQVISGSACIPGKV